jgi:UDP-N-acetylglucosamine--N-acetylmuramyl-(pentapeptide) pyrophosphoryl-undecaprenol N-acetylglucosamine transferase
MSDLANGNDPRPVLIMAGGTGGHVFPGLAVAEQLRAQSIPVSWLGSRGGMEAKLVAEHGLPFTGIAVQRLRGQGWRGWLGAPLALLRALVEAVAALRRLRPRAALALGGFAAGPGGLAAWLLRVPLIVHEQNRIPGLTNRMLVRLARRRLFAFAGPQQARLEAEVVGNPVRQSILDLPGQSRPHSPEHRHLLVLGGSQGARYLNQNLPAALARLDRSGLQIRHQAGANHAETTAAAYAAAGVEAEVSAFIGDMAQAYAWADLVICRSGALTVSELAAAGVGAVLVPFPFAVDDHQSANAQWLVEAGGAVILQEAETDVERLAGSLGQLLADAARLAGMARASRALAPLGAAQRVAQACLEVAR